MTLTQTEDRQAVGQGGMLQCATPCPPQRGLGARREERVLSDFIDRADLWPTVQCFRAPRACPDRCCQAESAV